MYLAKEAPRYHTGLYVDIACWSLLFILSCSMGAYLTFLNKRQERKRVALGLYVFPTFSIPWYRVNTYDRPAELKDMSIMDPVEADKYKIELTERLRAQGFDTQRMYQNAFDDLTDFQNPMFMYVI